MPYASFLGSGVPLSDRVVDPIHSMDSWTILISVFHGAAPITSRCNQASDSRMEYSAAHHGSVQHMSCVLCSVETTPFHPVHLFHPLLPGFSQDWSPSTFLPHKNTGSSRNRSRSRCEISISFRGRVHGRGTGAFRRERNVDKRAFRTVCTPWLDVRASCDRSVRSRRCCSVPGTRLGDLGGVGARAVEEMERTWRIGRVCEEVVLTHMAAVRCRRWPSVAHVA